MTTNDHTYPFDQADLQQINNGLMTVKRVKKLIAKAKAAGIPVDAHAADCDNCESFLEGIKTQFFTRKAND